MFGNCIFNSNISVLLIHLIVKNSTSVSLVSEATALRTAPRPLHPSESIFDIINRDCKTRNLRLTSLLLFRQVLTFHASGTFLQCDQKFRHFWKIEKVFGHFLRIKIVLGNFELLFLAIFHCWIRPLLKNWKLFGYFLRI